MLVVLSAALLLTSWYFGVQTPASMQGKGPSVPFAIAGWAALAGGLPMLGMGVYRLADHADTWAHHRAHRQTNG
ncbi:hypothetical protein ASD18_16260 [Cellulomonas sp. Root137]|nr:hypothetical protein ASD18_16260 [Cellulomonas sp. Root137]